MSRSQWLAGLGMGVAFILLAMFGSLLLLSRTDKSPLAEGQFAMIGMAIATPDLARTPTSVPSAERPPR